MNNDCYKFTWGDQVIVLESAPSEYRPASAGSVCGIYELDTEDKAQKYGGELGEVMYLLEFSDGKAVEVPGTFLMKEPNS